MERNTSELNAEIKTFNIFGEDIKCTKSLATYHETMEYYSDRKEPFFQKKHQHNNLIRQFRLIVLIERGIDIMDKFNLSLFLILLILYVIKMIPT